MEPIDQNRGTGTAASVLLILAHPDDESFMVAGSARLLVERGVRVALVCATRGDLGSVGEPPLATREKLPALRERELRDACAILGIDPVAVLDYHDRRLADAPADEIRETLVRVIRRERPRVVVTFDPNGVNGHPDHIAISRFAHDAVTAAADDRWLPALGPAHATARIVWPAPVEPWSVWRHDVLAALPGVDFLVDVSRTRDAKARALRAHRTQHRGIDPHWFASPHSAEILSTECFRLGWGTPAPVRPAGDLFDGL